MTDHLAASDGENPESRHPSASLAVCTPETPSQAWTSSGVNRVSRQRSASVGDLIASIASHRAAVSSEKPASYQASRSGPLSDDHPVSDIRHAPRPLIAPASQKAGYAKRTCGTPSIVHDATRSTDFA